MRARVSGGFYVVPGTPYIDTPVLGIQRWFDGISYGLVSAATQVSSYTRS